MRILILCTGNSCRSQMAHGFLQSFDKNIEIFSAGTLPSSMVSSKAVQVMAEVGIDISSHIPQNVSRYLNDEWDYAITVCDNAREMCPVFTGKVHHQLHFGFEDPSEYVGTQEEVLNKFRKIRDEIYSTFLKFYRKLMI